MCWDIVLDNHSDNNYLGIENRVTMNFNFNPHDSIQ